MRNVFASILMEARISHSKFVFMLRSEMWPIFTHLVVLLRRLELISGGSEEWRLAIGVCVVIH